MATAGLLWREREQLCSSPFTGQTTIESKIQALEDIGATKVHTWLVNNFAAAVASAPQAPRATKMDLGRTSRTALLDGILPDNEKAQRAAACLPAASMTNRS